jgi:hypothetical protein
LHSHHVNSHHGLCWQAYRNPLAGGMESAGRRKRVSFSILRKKNESYGGEKGLAFLLPNELRGEVDQHLAVVLADAAKK